MSSLYAEMHRTGLVYGPAYRMLKWGRVDPDSMADAVTGLRRRSDWQGTRVHPADVHAGTQSTGLVMPHDDSSQTRLPYVYDGALLRGAAVQPICSVRSTIHTLTTCTAFRPMSISL